MISLIANFKLAQLCALLSMNCNTMWKKNQIEMPEYINNFQRQFHQKEKEKSSDELKMNVQKYIKSQGIGVNTKR